MIKRGKHCKCVAAGPHKRAQSIQRVRNITLSTKEHLDPSSSDEVTRERTERPFHFTMVFPRSTITMFPPTGPNLLAQEGGARPLKGGAHLKSIDWFTHLTCTCPTPRSSLKKISKFQLFSKCYSDFAIVFENFNFQHKSNFMNL